MQVRATSILLLACRSRGVKRLFLLIDRETTRGIRVMRTSTIISAPYVVARKAKWSVCYQLLM